jgi:hypothetical protein
MNRRVFEKWDEATAAASRNEESCRGEFLKKEIFIAVRYLQDFIMYRPCAFPTGFVSQKIMFP